MSMSKLGIALRRRFKTPKDVLKKLGLDERLLSIPRLAFDQRNIGAIPGTSSKMELEEMLCTVLSGHELQRARDLLHSIDADDGEQLGAEDDEDVDEEALREERRRAMARTAGFLADRKGMSEDDIAETLSDFPKNGLEHLGGALDDDLERLMKERRRSMATDATRRRLAFDRRFPESGRVGGGSVSVATHYGDPVPARRIGADSAGAKSFYERFPGAQRIG